MHRSSAHSFHTMMERKSAFTPVTPKHRLQATLLKTNYATSGYAHGRVNNLLSYVDYDEGL